MICKAKESLAGRNVPMTRHSLQDAKFLTAGLAAKVINQDFILSFELVTVKERLGLDYDEVLGLLHRFHDLQVWQEASPSESLSFDDFLSYMEAAVRADGTNGKLGQVLAEVRARVSFHSIEEVSREHYLHLWEGIDYRDDSGALQSFRLTLRQGPAGTVRYDLSQRQGDDARPCYRCAGVLQLQGGEEVNFEINTEEQNSAGGEEDNPVSSSPSTTTTPKAFLGRIWLQADWNKREWRLRAMIGKPQSAAGGVTKGVLSGMEWPERQEPNPSKNLRFVEFRRKEKKS